MKIPEPEQLPSGRWRIKVMVDGRRVGKTFDSKDEAIYWAAGAKSKMIKDKKFEEPKRTTLDDAIKQYIADNETILSPATIRGYDGIRKHRFKSLMHKEVLDITKRDFQQAVNAEKSTVSAKTISNAYGLVHTVLTEFGNRIDGIKLPQKKKVTKRYLQPNDLAKLIASASGDECETGILIAAMLGLRRSEIIGLCWDCVDFDQKTITVSRTVVPDKNHKLVLKDTTKNESSQRTLDCPDIIISKLEELYKPEFAGQAIRVFNYHPDRLRKHIHKVCAAAGITDTTVHGLRHTNAAVMKSLGIADDVAMQRGGWTSENTYRQTYSYVFDQRSADAAKAMNNFFKNELSTENVHGQ